MTNILRRITNTYRLLLRLYPGSFRSQFEEQMLLDFIDMATDASKNGSYPLLVFCLHELFDLPISLIRIHLKEGFLIKIFRSRHINQALRGALGYGVAFGLAILIGELVVLKLFIEENSIIGNIQVLYFDWFHTEHGLELIGWLTNAIGSLLSGLVLGVLFAVLFADRSNYGRYILVGMLGWFLHDAIVGVLWYSANLGFFLGDRHTNYFNTTASIMSGAFLAVIFIAAKSEKKEPVRLLVFGSIAYPLIAYFYVKLLFKLLIIEAPWMFVALLSLMAFYLVSVFVIALKSGLGRRAIWMMAAGTASYQLLPFVLHNVLIWVSLLVPSPVIPPGGVPVGSVTAWQIYSQIALHQSIYGMLFGLIMGLLFGFLNQRKLHQEVAT